MPETNKQRIHLFNVGRDLIPETIEQWKKDGITNWEFGAAKPPELMEPMVGVYEVLEPHKDT